MKKGIVQNFLVVLGLFMAVGASAQQWGLYTLYAPKNNTKAYLIDTATSPATYKTWTFASTKKNGYSTYLVAGDTLVRTYSYQSNVLNGGGMTGGIQKVAWNGTVTWDFVHSTSSYCIHHDICPMPNGNVLLISYEVKTNAEVSALGCTTNLTSGMWSEKIIEVKQTGPTTGTIVWEWHLTDHVCQNVDAGKPGYVTSIVQNPQLININYHMQKDWWHMNGIDYNEELDQIVISSHNMNECYVIDHSTTAAEAAGHTGGTSGKGGDFLYRWGNPQAYGATGTTNFNVVHDAHFVPTDNPNYPGYFCAYNNQGGAGGKTAIDVWLPPRNGNSYDLTVGQAYLPSAYTYRYTATWTASNEGNSQQLPNGNMLVNNAFGSIYEINPAGTVLWTKSAAQSSHAYRFEKCFIRGHVANATASETSICEGDEISLSVTATSVTETSPVYSYNWSNGGTSATVTDSPTADVLYFVTVTNTSIGCTATDSVSVTVLPAPAQPEISAAGTSLTSTAGNSYQWYLDGNPVTGATNQTWDAQEDGSYQVMITGANGCTSMSEEFLYIGSGFGEVLNEMKIYPNPASGIVHIEVPGGNEGVELKIFSTCGQVMQTEINGNETDLSVLPNGVYFMTVVKDGQVIAREKICIIK